MPLFAALAPAALQRLADQAERCELGSGASLYSENDTPAWFYVLLRGRLRVTSRGTLLGYISRGEPVGEMGVVSGEPRNASVHAVRDSLLLRIPAAAFLDFLRSEPEALLDLTRLVIARGRQYQSQRRLVTTGQRGSFAVIPASPGVPAVRLAEALVQQFSGWPQARLVTASHVDANFGSGFAQTALDDAAAGERLRAWLSELEERHAYVVYAADNFDDPWSLRCLRQADRILILAEAQSPPRDVPVLDQLHAQGLIAPVELVLLRAQGEPSPHTLAWCRESCARAHYFVHPWAQDELAALARQITGRGIGLVLGGGGARGFAHIGLVRALEQLQIPVDVCGGTSMGAFVSALLACGFDSVEMAQIARETFIARNYLNDYTMPRVSLIRGQRFLKRLRAIFGERRIEELRRSYYCISTNLTTGATVVHDRGELASWVGTSMCVPGVAPPVAWQGELLCDGGVVNNLPTDVMQNLERGTIIASNVSSEGEIRAPGAGAEEPDQSALLNWKGEHRIPRLSEILMRSATLTSDTAIQRASIERADVYLRMPIQDIGMFDWLRLEELVERGYEYALEQLGPLRDKLPRA
ncbi:cyclic nucleotide-binding protein [Solimonas sp. K1W22B-7]|nr:cyclic nucleotide-binding protein [Solimonas sp. K1W22B-7]